MTTFVKHVTTAKTLHTSLLKDVSYALGDNVTCSTLSDIDTLYERVRTRGPSVLMDVLPDLCKLYENGLSSGSFSWDLYPKDLRRKNGSGYQRYIFGDLIGLTFHLSIPGFPECEVDPDVVQATRSLLLLFKKVRMDSSDSAKHKARQEFKTLDESLPEQDDFWDFESDTHSGAFGNFYRSRHPQWVSTILVLMDRIAGVISPGYNIRIDDYKPKHGPGAVSDLRSGSDKYSFPSWPKSLSSVFPSNGWATHLHDCADDSVPEYWGSDPCSKLICVPKTLSKPRVIASEPTAMQYCQQAVMQMLRDSMDPILREMINFTSQEPSREHALIASRTGSHGTVDLSAASDRVTCDHVGALFKYNRSLLHALRATRTRHVEINDGDIIKIKKFAAMGSATTFPVQSILYSVAALAVSYWDRFPELGTLVDRRLLSEIVNQQETRITVFGDDIIVPSKHVVYLSVIFEALGLKVNEKKTHHTGSFRESCGMDAFNGTEVTPLYLAHIGQVGASDVATTVEIRNNAYLKGYWNLAKTLESSIPKQFSRYIPKSNVALPSLRYISYLDGTFYPSSKKRWHMDLQVNMTKGFVVRSKQERECRNDWGDLLQYFIEGSRDKRSSVEHLAPTKWELGWSSHNRISFEIRWVLSQD